MLCLTPAIPAAAGAADDARTEALKVRRTYLAWFNDPDNDACARTLTEMGFASHVEYHRSCKAMASNVLSLSIIDSSADDGKRELMLEVRHNAMLLFDKSLILGIGVEAKTIGCIFLLSLLR